MVFLVELRTLPEASALNRAGCSFSDGNRASNAPDDVIPSSMSAYASATRESPSRNSAMIGDNGTSVTAGSHPGLMSVQTAASRPAWVRSWFVSPCAAQTSSARFAS